MKKLICLEFIFFFISAWVLPCGASIQTDTAFGSSGIVVTDYGIGDDQVNSVAIQSDGKIAAVGSSFNGAVYNAAVARYTADGRLDSTFSNDGKNTFSFGSGDSVAEAAVTNDAGLILVAGETQDPDSMIFVARLTETGILDTTYGTNGFVTVSVSDYDLYAADLVIGASGDTFIAGHSVDTGANEYAIVVKIDSEGAIDTTFGTDGVLTLGNGDSSAATSIALLDDNLIVAGIQSDGGSQKGFFAGFTQSGAVVNSFGSSGVTLIDYNSQDSAIADFVVSGTGLILGAGYIKNDSTQLPIAVRLQADGNIDTAFGTLGITLVSSPTGTVLQAASLYEDAELLLSGVVEQNGQTNIFIALGSNVLETDGSESIISWLTKTIVQDADATANTVAQVGTAVFLVGGSLHNGSDYDFSIYQFTTVESAADAEVTAAEETAATTDSTTVQTYEVTQVTRTSAAGGGKVYGTDSDVSLRGVCYSITQSPEYADDTESTDTESTDTGSTDTESTDSETVTASSIFSLTTETDRKKGNLLAQYSDSGRFDLVESGCTEDGSGVGAFTSDITGIIPGMQYYARAYAVLLDGSVVYGDQVSFKTADACFIATAAFGSILDEHVVILRNFRDQMMTGNSFGRKLISIYYAYSPMIAEKIAQSSVLRSVTRVVLLPVIVFCYVVLNSSAFLLGGITLLLTGLILAVFSGRFKIDFNGVQ